ncbi:hypothetical protein THAOC_36596 [Thalassiosira oceanica]|uniref:Uncharacterized protein n=1 Tax=Thalassiosira oceanica TaxID=159749 RepID=K0QZY1_THAOC|nr:hypothetical protein THAOC_36596 [Thalassiosira oceanica]|eukprot:EJK44835.1 hypothetical protein THAOC_36596 [Thalassiosira oceanica]
MQGQSRHWPRSDSGACSFVFVLLESGGTHTSAVAVASAARAQCVDGIQSPAEGTSKKKSEAGNPFFRESSPGPECINQCICVKQGVVEMSTDRVPMESNFLTGNK